MLEDLHRFHASMRALWLDRHNCSHNVSQKVRRIKRISDRIESGLRTRACRPGMCLVEGGLNVKSPKGLRYVFGIRISSMSLQRLRRSL